MEPEDLRLVVEYIYCGEVRVTQERLDSVMAVAEVLGIRGLLSSGQPQQPCKKRRLYEEGGGEAQRSERSVITSCSSSASNGGQARSPVGPRPATARQPLSATASQRPGGTADITDSFNDIRPDILEMIKEEQKVSLCPALSAALELIITLFQAKLLEPNTNWNSSSSANLPPGMCYVISNLAVNRTLQSIYLFRRAWRSLLLSESVTEYVAEMLEPERISVPGPPLPRAWSNEVLEVGDHGRGHLVSAAGGTLPVPGGQEARHPIPDLRPLR